ncbi:MAG: sporulation protein YjcZ [Gammaproteobacteria bacterium]|nr:sporulation protein YjcZ [Gammaproteobacteria bacterium]MCP4982168.1 sporulation protein YjcZ [Gammaproteobacteria bacterium]
MICCQKSFLALNSGISGFCLIIVLFIN